MCGICGISPSSLHSPDPDRLRRMNDAIRHRGPDGEGFYIAEGIGLAMRRLAIIDVQGGQQPIPNEDERLWIVFNGEIYNFLDLRPELERRGHRFRTRSDTECILHLYEDEGEAALSRLRGMFAIAIWDSRKRRLFLARDRLGKKPLYYTVQQGSLYFASELSALLEALPQHPPVKLEALDLYLSLQYIPDPFTAYEGVYKLPPAHFLVWENGQVRIERYWDLTYQPKWQASEAELADELRARLKEAVRLRLISEVPLGAHLSGGIDSSIIVALMAELSDAPVKTFSVGFEEESFSELVYARAVAERYATDHHEFILRYSDLPTTLETILGHFGEPFADPSAIPLYHLSCLTREYVTVALNGDGGDEAFAGYHRYRLDPWANRYLRAPQFLTRSLVPAIVRLLPDASERPAGQSLINGLKRLAQLPEIDPRASLLRWSSYFTPSQRLALWKPECRQNLNAHSAVQYMVEYFESAQGSWLDRTLYTDLHTYLPGDLLVKADRMTMAASLEGRSPFLDHELMEWAARLPDHLKVRGWTGKVLLRRAFAHALPSQVGKRGKQGFGIPLATWFRGPLYTWSRDLLLDPHSPLAQWFNPVILEQLLEEHRRGRADHGKRLYALVMLALWARTATGS
uniref:asparagine synthase (glutamine-hydrolyzing) n=1 Tax=uncultured Chloroflexota bacterium TaxID=166587 RepID=H5SHL7_9CHLR|nr:asparagine synthase, glutamine-hydrolyzing [uncultured Chloroflexota bacterium]